MPADPSNAGGHLSRTRPLPRFVPVAAGAAPWAWFAVRDHGVIFEAIATFLPPIMVTAAGLVVGLGWWFRARAMAIAAVSWLVVGSVAVVGPWLPAGGRAPTRPMRVVFANLNYVNSSIDKALRDVAAEKGDLVVVTETVPFEERVQRSLQRVYPFSARTPGGDPLLFARYPVRMLNIEWSARADRLDVQSPGGRLVILTAHPPRPHLGDPRRMLSDFAEHGEKIDAMVSTARRQRSPTLVLGDLNLSDRTRGYRRLATELHDAMRSGFARPTYMKLLYRPMLLRIDHLFISRGWCATGSRHFRVSGSDHEGITAIIGPCPGRA